MLTDKHGTHAHVAAQLNLICLSRWDWPASSQSSAPSAGSVAICAMPMQSRAALPNERSAPAYFSTALHHPGMAHTRTTHDCRSPARLSGHDDDRHHILSNMVRLP